MKEPVPQTYDKPTTSRDGPAFVVGLVVAVAILRLGPCGDWISGRTNGWAQAPAILVMLGPVWLVAAIWLLVRSLTRLGNSTAMQRTRYIVLLAAVWGSPLLFLVGRDKAFSAGFASWAKVNVDVAAIRQWAGTAPSDSTWKASGNMAGWRGHHDPDIIRQIPEAAWPQSVVRVKPSEVGIVSDYSAVVLLWWRENHFGFERLLVITMSETPMPPLELQPTEAWRHIGDRTWVYTMHE